VTRSRTVRAIALGAAALSLAAMIAYLGVWLRVDRLEVGHSDFVPTYVAGTLLREGHGASIYDTAAERPVYERLTPGDHLLTILPYMSPPAAAAVAAPLTLLDLPTAYRVWGLLQLLLLIGATVLVVRAAPWPATTTGAVRVACGGLALAGLGTGEALLLGQWDGMLALGLAVAYACWRRGRMATGAAVLGLAAGLTKPHLCLGLAALLLAWRDRRMILAGLAGVAATVVAGTLVAGPGAWLGMLHANTWEATSTARPMTDLVGLVGVGGEIGGQGTAGRLIGYGLAALAVAVAFAVGRRTRGRPGLLEPALGCAVLLSLLAAPHILPHDMALLSPVIAWTLARLAGRDAAEGQGWPGRWGLRSVALLALLNGAVAVSLTSGRLIDPALVVPPCLLLGAALLWLDARGARLRPAVAPVAIRPGCG
jgi:hypothetical protein